MNRNQWHALIELTASLLCILKRASSVKKKGFLFTLWQKKLLWWQILKDCNNRNILGFMKGFCVSLWLLSHFSRSPWILTIGIFYSLLEQLRRVSHFTSAFLFTAVLNNNTYSVGTKTRCKSNWFHWKVDKKEWLVVEGFLQSLTHLGLITVHLSLETFPVSTGHQPLEALTYSTVSWASAAWRKREKYQMYTPLVTQAPVPSHVGSLFFYFHSVRLFTFSILTHHFRGMLKKSSVICSFTVQLHLQWL